MCVCVCVRACMHVCVYICGAVEFEGYRELVATFTGLMEKIGKEVEEEKMKVSSLLQNISKRSDRLSHYGRSYELCA